LKASNGTKRGVAAGHRSSDEKEASYDDIDEFFSSIHKATAQRYRSVGVARFRGDIVRIAIDEKVSVAPISNTIVKLAVCCLFLARPRLRPASGIRQFDTAGRGAAGSAASLMAGPKF
jgi:hypothetical protein